VSGTILKVAEYDLWEPIEQYEWQGRQIHYEANWIGHTVEDTRPDKGYKLQGNSPLVLLSCLNGEWGNSPTKVWHFLECTVCANWVAFLAALVRRNHPAIVLK